MLLDRFGSIGEPHQGHLLLSNAVYCLVRSLIRRTFSYRGGADTKALWSYLAYCQVA